MGFSLYTHPVDIQGKSLLQGNIRYISLAVPLILKAAMVQIILNCKTLFTATLLLTYMYITVRVIVTMVKLNLLMLKFAIKLLYVTYSASTGHGKITVQFCFRIFESKKTLHLCHTRLWWSTVYRTPKIWQSKQTSLQSTGSWGWTRFIHPFSAFSNWWHGYCSKHLLHYKRIAVKLSEKSNTPYAMTMAWLRTNICFSLLRLAIQCIRSSCSRNGRPQTETGSHSSSNAELVTVESSLRIHYSCFELLYLLYLFIYFEHCTPPAYDCIDFQCKKRKKFWQYTWVRTMA